MSVDEEMPGYDTLPVPPLDHQAVADMAARLQRGESLGERLLSDVLELSTP